MNITITLQFKKLEEAELAIKNLQRGWYESCHPKDLKEIVGTSLRKNKQWTQFEIDYVAQNYHKYKARHIARSLGRSPSSVRNLAHKLIKRGIIKHKNRNRNGKVFSV